MEPFNIWDLMKQNQQMQPSPLLASNAPVQAQPAPIAMPKLNKVAVSMRMPSEPSSYDKQLQEAYQNMMTTRTAANEEMKQKLAALQENTPTGLAAIDLGRAANFVDSVTGSNMSSTIKGNPLADHKAEMQKLQDSITKEQNGLSDDQLNYLKMRAQEESANKRLSMSISAQDRLAKKAASGQASGLRDQWLKNPLTKATQEVATAYEKVKKAANDPSPAGDISLIFGYMKMLDPGSVVREGEFATAQNAASVPERIRNAYNRAISGTRLGSDGGMQRADFLNQAHNVFQGQMEQQGRFDNRFVTLSGDLGIDPKHVVLSEIFQGVNDKAGNMVTVSNGTETLQIPAEDLAAATKDGYKQVR